LKYGYKSTNCKIKENAQIQIKGGAEMFPVRQKTRVYEKVRFVPDMFPRSGQSGLDPGGNQEQLVKK
jgi:hypothetical protein